MNQLLAEANAATLSPEVGELFDRYLALLVRWNARTNLTAIRDQESIVSRHFLESILVAYLIPIGITSLLDFGSGAGFPGLPIALLRPEIEVTLAESQNKKAAFLREAVRVLGGKTRVHSGRAELLKQRFDCVALRAVDNMGAALPDAAGMLCPSGWLAVMSTLQEIATIHSAVPEIQFHDPLCLVPGTSRILILGKKHDD